MIFGKLTNKKSSTNVLFGAFIRRKKETTKFDYKCFNLRRDIMRPDDISSEIETFVVEFSCFFLSS